MSQIIENNKNVIAMKLLEYYLKIKKLKPKKKGRTK